MTSVDPKLLSAIRSIKASRYPSANTVLLQNDQSVVYEKGGQFSNTMHQIRVVLTPTGKDRSASADFPYAKDAERMTVLLARVIKPDGTVIPVPRRDIKDTDQSGEMNIYDPNGRTLRVTFEGLSVGDAVETVTKLERLTPTRPGFFNDIFDFQAAEPIVESNYSVDGPASLPLTAALYHPERGGKLKATRNPAGDRIHYSWTMLNARQVVPEQMMDFQQEVPVLIVSTDPSWEHFSRWWAELTTDKIQSTPDLVQKVKDLTRDAKTDAEKIQALYDFVSGDIRYRGLGVGPRTGYTPRPADETYTSRWGVCRDVSILLTSMLRIAGFQAYPVLTNVGEPVLSKIAYDGFNHAIVAMPAPDGKWTYLDPTAKNNSALLPGYEHEQSALVCTGKGEPLGEIPPEPPSDNLGHAIATTRLGADGVLTSEVTLASQGVFDLIFRSWAAQMSPKQIRDTAESLIHAKLASAKLQSFSVSDYRDLKAPLTVHMTIEVPGAAVEAGRFRILSTMVTSGALGLVEAILPQTYGDLPSRKYGLDTVLTLQYDEDESVSLPPGTKVLAVPNPVHTANRVSSLDATCREEKTGTLDCHRSFQVRRRYIAPKEYLQLRSVLGQMGQLSQQPVILSAMGVL